jgi:hypothetical protein
MGQVSVSKLATFVVVAMFLEDLVLRPADWGVKSALQDLAVWIEASYLTDPIGIRLIGGFGDKSDEFGIFDEDAVALGEE